MTTDPSQLPSESVDNPGDSNKPTNNNSNNNPNTNPANTDNSTRITAPTNMSVLVAGATGSIGRYCVYLLVRDPRVTQVTALTRSNPKPFDFYGLDESTDPVSKLQHLIVDYEEKTASLDEQLLSHRYSCGLSCIGVYSNDVKNEADFFAREYAPNMRIANAAAAHGVHQWSYLSGQGVYPSVSQKWSQLMFSWVKGSVERDLQTVAGFERVCSARPGAILGRPDSKLLSGVSGWFEKKANAWKWVANTSMAVHRNAIAKAMLYPLLCETNNHNDDDNCNALNACKVTAEAKDDVVDDNSNTTATATTTTKSTKCEFIVYENEKIKEIANAYDTDLAAQNG